MKINRIAFFGAALCAAVIMAVSCGKKAPPRAPDRQQLPVAEDLELESRGDSLVLKWSLEESVGKDIKEPAGFIVFREKTPEGLDCPDCPDEFERAGWVAYRSGRSVPDTWYFEEAALSGHVYRYRVRCYSPDGRLGKESETVGYTVEENGNARDAE